MALPASPSRTDPPLHYLTFTLTEGADGVSTLEAMASTRADRHPAVLAEAQAVLAWARSRFPDTQGPVEDGHDWDHDLQVSEEDGAWSVVTLTLAASPAFLEAFVEQFGPLQP